MSSDVPTVPSGRNRQERPLIARRRALTTHLSQERRKVPSKGYKVPYYERHDLPIRENASYLVTIQPCFLPDVGNDRRLLLKVVPDSLTRAGDLTVPPRLEHNILCPDVSTDHYMWAE